MRLGRKTLDIVSMLRLACWDSIATATATALSIIRAASDYPETGVYCAMNVDQGYSFLTLVLRTQQMCHPLLSS
jgi:hypothetical protein